eukprot:6184627-Pleurochrysis_carterae.AAC.1
MAVKLSYSFLIDFQYRFLMGSVNSPVVLCGAGPYFHRENAVFPKTTNNSPRCAADRPRAASWRFWLGQGHLRARARNCQRRQLPGHGGTAAGAAARARRRRAD